MVWRWIHSTRRAIVLAVGVVVVLGPLGGCAMWNKDRWNLDRYRDERAVDIDQRLSQDRSIVPNPF